jgi:hypothetical protein
LPTRRGDLLPDSLCVRVLKAKYYSQGNLLDTVVAYDASQTWRAIEHGLELLKKGTVLAMVKLLDFGETIGCQDLCHSGQQVVVNCVG